eukprot:1304623-Pyramimonas_sp.AAC.1
MHDYRPCLAETCKETKLCHRSPVFVPLFLAVPFCKLCGANAVGPGASVGADIHSTLWGWSHAVRCPVDSSPCPIQGSGAWSELIALPSPSPLLVLSHFGSRFSGAGQPH